MRSSLFFSLFLLLQGCSTYQMKVSGAYEQLSRGNYSGAAELLKPMAEQENDDQLVYLLDYGLSLQLAGNYAESNKVFLKAETIADIQDYHSISRVTGSLLLNEGIVQYKGEDFENVLINAFVAINFLCEGNLENALTQARRLNNKLYRYKFEAKRDYEQNPFARYISAMMYESEQNWDSSYIEYEETYRLNPNIPQLKSRLIYAARKAARPEVHKKWREKFNDTVEEKEWSDSSYGELVLIYQQGQGPVKRPHPEFPRFPKLYSRSTRGQSARLEIPGLQAVSTEVVFNSESLAIKVLDDAYLALAAKRAAGLATKAVVAHQIGQKNEVLGQLAWIGMNLADQADLRQWSTLPQTFQVARKTLKAGKYLIKVVALDAAGAPTGEEMPSREVEIKPKAKTFLNWRSFQ